MWPVLVNCLIGMGDQRMGVEFKGYSKRSVESSVYWNFKGMVQLKKKKKLPKNVQNTHLSLRNAYLQELQAYLKHKTSIEHEEFSP